jgi:uncharacterized sulfatase
MSRICPIYLLLAICFGVSALNAKPINVLFAISDDQSWPHAGAYGTAMARTPAFDRLAEQGILFNNAFAPAPQCSPCRAAILTGKNIWQLEEAGTHGSLFPNKFPVFTGTMESAGYHVGFTGKPWSPGNWRDGGWERNPVGREYNEKLLTPPTDAISSIDYSSNFRAFLQEREKGQPFFFWYGGIEPHRTYTEGSGATNGIAPEKVPIPGFLPDEPIVRNDIADYLLEIEWFDKHLGEMLQILEAAGELENTLIIVTADNGMPFPSAKANLYELGTHVPLVIKIPRHEGGIKSEALVSLIDIGPTILDYARLPALEDIAGKSLLPSLREKKVHREFVVTGRERHTHARPDNLGYPARAIRTDEFLYIWNIHPERWPAGDPTPKGLTPEQLDGSLSDNFKSVVEGYEDVDSSPTKLYMLNEDSVSDLLYAVAFKKRPSEQLYNINKDPFCLNDIASHPDTTIVKEQLRALLMRSLKEEKDPRVSGNGDIFESYPRFDKMRFFPGFKKRGEYNPEYQRSTTSNTTRP